MVDQHPFDHGLYCHLSSVGRLLPFSSEDLGDCIGTFALNQHIFPISKPLPCWHLVNPLVSTLERLGWLRGSSLIPASCYSRPWQTRSVQGNSSHPCSSCSLLSIWIRQDLKHICQVPLSHMVTPSQLCRIRPSLGRHSFVGCSEDVEQWIGETASNLAAPMVAHNPLWWGKPMRWALQLT